MREIKFRAWSGRLKIMTLFDNAPVVGQYPIGDDEVYWGMLFTTNAHRVPLTGYDEIMQFTGLHDKNGKEICEGDILKSSTTGILFPVTWWAEKAKFRAVKGNIFLDSAKSWKNAEIVGNIHQNPELLSK